MGKDKTVSKYLIYYLILFLFIVYAWYTSPLSIKNEIKGEVVGINIEKTYSTPGLDRKIVRNQINTSDLSEISNILDFMNNYKYCKNIKLSDDVRGYSKPVTAFWINLYYITDTGEDVVYHQYINSEGHMSAGGWGEKDFSCDIGRFGNAGTKEYFNQLNKIFYKKSRSNKWNKSKE